MRRLVTIIILAGIAFFDAFSQPLPPVNIRSTGSLRSIQIQWEKSPSSGVTKYIIYRSSPQFLPTYYRLAEIPSNGNVQYQFTDYFALANVWEYYYITAIGTGGSSIPSTVTRNKLTAAGNSIVIISEPATQYKIGSPRGYDYHLQAVSPDTGATLSYSLTVRPDGMFVTGDGEIVWPNPVAGIHSVVIRAAQNTGQRQAAVQSFRLRVVPRVGSVTGLVQSAGGVNIPWARVLLFNINDPENVYETRANGNGVYYFPDVAAGSYYLAAEALWSGYGYSWYPNAVNFVNASAITVVEGQTTTADFLNSLPVRGSLRAVSGIVRDESGNPLANAVVSAFSSDRYYPIGSDSLRIPSHLALADWDQLSPEYSVTSGSDGQFSLNLPQGKTFYLSAKKQGYRQTYRGNAPSPIQATPLVVDPNTPSTTFLMKPQTQGSTVSGSIIEVGTRQPIIGTPVVIVQRGGGHVMFMAVTADTSGNYTFNDVPDGWYSIIALPVGELMPSYYRMDGVSLFWQQSDSIHVSSGDVRDVDISVPATRRRGLASIAGQVTDGGSSEPIAALTVFAFLLPDTVNAVAYAVTDTSGRYKVEGLLPGTYILRTDKGGYHTGQSSQITVNYTGNNAISNIEIEVTVSSLAQVPPGQPRELRLEQNFPNPFNPSTTIRYNLPERGRVTLKVFNALGAEIETLASEIQNAGIHTVTFTCGSHASGVYYYRLQASDRMLTRHMILLR